MSRQGRIMIVDDDERWREIPAKTLRRGGFHVDTAPTAAEAIKYLEEMPYHLLVLDVRMEEHDPGNIDGMTLLDKIRERGLNKALKVIMLSAHGTREQLRATFKDYRVIDFLAKDDFDNLVFLELVQSIFPTEIKVNLKLAIHWQQGSSPEQAILNMDVAGVRMKRNSALHNRVIMELDDLLCRLFYEAESILVEQLTPGRSGTRVLHVRPFYTTGSGNPVVVKFGSADRIEEEYSNFKHYVQSFVGGGRCTSLLDMRRTAYLGGISYSLLGFANDHLEDFGGFYQRSTTQEIEKVLHELFQYTCSTWYANPGVLHPHNLTNDYQQLFGYRLDRLEQVVSEYLKSVQGKQKLLFTSLNNARSFTNPLQAATGVSIVLPTYVCTTHGDFNQNNILVDSDGHVWLIDFQGTGRGHILRDVAMLDSAIRFQLLEVDEATLEERLYMEETLNNVERFSHMKQLVGKLASKNAALLKAYDSVVHLRMIAYKLVDQNPDDNIKEYNTALFYNALNAVRFSSLQPRQREHALLCASLLADRLGMAR